MDHNRPDKQDLTSLDTLEVLLATDPATDPTRATFQLVYHELKSIAHHQLARGGGHNPLCTTELVHEAYVKLVGSTDITSRGRAYFFGAAAQAMRQLLVDRARAHLSQKRGGGFVRVTWDDSVPDVGASAEELLAIHDALSRLEVESDRAARVVECRYFAGLSVEETAEVLNVSPRTVKADFAFARAWLFRELGYAQRS